MIGAVKITGCRIVLAVIEVLFLDLEEERRAALRVCDGVGAGAGGEEVIDMLDRGEFGSRSGAIFGTGFDFFLEITGYRIVLEAIEVLVLDLEDKRRAARRVCDGVRADAGGDGLEELRREEDEGEGLKRNRGEEEFYRGEEELIKEKHRGGGRGHGTAANRRLLAVATVILQTEKEIWARFGREQQQRDFEKQRQHLRPLFKH
ncbi:uncharacterized protein LOC131026315 [Salvia miltiorrhiza]|uniref:uncharacterized protein LOC131026315 n=1 Tax=Salvia miltiorrhiza TaxID=226208 RepID=UPI0025ABDC2F|nr:uncharacterized protein LOC131026315 [Salvia miltiorrhiza]